MVLQWNKDKWRLAWQGKRGLPSALLLAGPTGLGKTRFAVALAQAALCSARTSENYGCGTCHSCRLFMAAAHPDLRVLEASVPEEAAGEGTAPKGSSSSSRVIGVDRIRELRDFIELSPHLGGRKVVLINPAERLHPSAANALLKTLEEPTPGTLFVLVSARPQQLLPTIRSRCFRLDFRVPSSAQALGWMRQEGIADPQVPLSHAGGAPLAAAELARSSLWRRRSDITRLLVNLDVKPDVLARAIEPDEVAAFCGLLYKWCADLIGLRLAGKIRYNPDYAQPLEQLAVNSDVLKLQKLMKDLTVQLRYLEHPLNQRLVCEKVALSYARAICALEH